MRLHFLARCCILCQDFLVLYFLIFNIINIEENTYIVFNSFLGLMILGGVLNNQTKARCSSFLMCPNQKSTLQSFTTVVLFFSSVAFLLTIILFPALLTFKLSKIEILRSMPPTQNLWSYPAIIGTITAFYIKNKRLLLWGVGLLLLDVALVSNRSNFVLTCLAIIYLHHIRLGPIRLSNRFKLFFLVLLLFYIMIVFKSLSYAARHDGLQGIVENIIDPIFLFTSLLKLESFAQQGILNEVIKTGFNVPIQYLFTPLLVLVPYINKTGILHIKEYNFSYITNINFFPSSAPDTIASNVFAEIYALGGWSLFTIFIVMGLLLAGIQQRLILSTRNHYIKIFLILLVPYLYFYMHRNTLFITLGYIKRFVLLFMFFVFLVKIWKLIKYPKLK